MANQKAIKNLAKYAVEKYGDDFEYIGIRIQDDTFGKKPGDNLGHCSSIWDDNDKTDEPLNGACAFDARQGVNVNEFWEYFGNKALILGSFSCEYGDDLAEIIMRGAEIIEIVDIE